jgi:hypothetical protein
MSDNGLKVSASMKEATNCAHSARTAPANSRRPGAPTGPKPEPVRVNGVPIIKTSGVSK